VSTTTPLVPFDQDPEWFRRAVFYEVMVRSYHDSNGDGIGDLAGLAAKLDYLQWLGVDCLWLPPFFPSPMADGGYDVSDYCNVMPEFGTLTEFVQFVDGAHERGIKIIIDFVANHTSDQHPWFQASRADPEGPYGDYYVWSDNDALYADARIIFLDTETSNWTHDEVRGQYFWHRFYFHQPDLNFENPRVVADIIASIRFWLDLGIDGFRLDAVPYLIEQDGTNCENLPGTHAILKQIRAAIDASHPGRVLLCEANQWPHEVVEYYGSYDAHGGDECHMAFHFPVMPRLYMGLRRADRSCITEILADTPQIPAGCQWGTFLRNHDELTLEMVSASDRDDMWNEYAPDPRMISNIGIRRRLAPLVDGDMPRVHLLHAMLLSLPGSPVLYYGDEIGMGDNIWLHDRDGVRTPMQWQNILGAGFSAAEEQDFFLPLIQDPRYATTGVNVEDQMLDPGSLLQWLRALLVIRKSHPVFSLGAFTDVGGENLAVFSFLRSPADASGEPAIGAVGESVLCVNNLSDVHQSVELDLSAFRGLCPDDLLARREHPVITGDPYQLEVAPHGFVWLALVREPPVETDTETENDAAASAAAAAAAADAAAAKDGT